MPQGFEEAAKIYPLCGEFCPRKGSGISVDLAVLKKARAITDVNAARFAWAYNPTLTQQALEGFRRLQEELPPVVHNAMGDEVETSVILRDHATCGLHIGNAACKELCFDKQLNLIVTKDEASLLDE